MTDTIRRFRESPKLQVCALAALVMCVVGAYRWRSTRSAEGAQENTTPGLNDLSPSAVDRSKSSATSESMAIEDLITWPVEIRKDPFEWETVFGTRTPVATVPTEPAPDPMPTPPTIHLQAILVGAAPRALVNGTVLESGDWIGDVQIIRINRRSILVARDDMTWAIELN